MFNGFISDHVVVPSNFRSSLHAIAQHSHHGAGMHNSDQMNPLAILHGLHASLPDLINPVSIAGFWAILSYSLLSSLHCATMCGPLACSVLSGGSRPRTTALLYNAGRGVSYIVVGALLAGAHGYTSAYLPQIGRYLAIATGCLVILIALRMTYSGGFTPNSTEKKSQTTSLPAKLLNLLAGVRGSRRSALTLGILTVALPCMTLTPVLVMAASTPNVFGGMAIMTAFWLGTAPMMIAVTIAPAKLPTIMTRLFGARTANSRKVIKYLTALFLGLAGVLTILRGFA